MLIILWAPQLVVLGLAAPVPVIAAFSFVSAPAEPLTAVAPGG